MLLIIKLSKYNFWQQWENKIVKVFTSCFLVVVKYSLLYNRKKVNTFFKIYFFSFFCYNNVIFVHPPKRSRIDFEPFYPNRLTTPYLGVQFRDLFNFACDIRFSLPKTPTKNFFKFQLTPETTYEFLLSTNTIKETLITSL